MKDIDPGSDSSTPHAFARLGDRLLFSAVTVATGYELFRTDGTAGGTGLLKNIGGVGSSHADYLVRLRQRILFRAETAETGVELFRSDGTPGGTKLLKEIRPGTTGSDPFGCD